MAGADKIIGKILDDAKTQSDRIWQENGEAIAVIKREAEAEAQKLVAQIKKGSEADVIETRRRMLSVAELEARKDELRMRREVIDEIFSGAERTLEAFSGVERELFLKRVAVREAEGGETLTPSAADRRYFEKGLVSDINKELEREGKAPIVLDAGDAPIRGGFLLSLGNIEKNCSFQALIRELREEEETSVAKLLFA